MNGSDPRSYAGARSYARVARSNSTDSLERGFSATRRWTAKELRTRIVDGPPFRHRSPDESTLQDMVLGYEQVTRDPVHRSNKRNLVAACYRVHGPALLDRVRTLFIETGTATNLLGMLRTTAPELFDARTAHPVPDESPPPPRPAVPAHPTDTTVKSPPFDPTSTRRYDLHPWSPDEGTLFDASELGSPPDRSPTARTLGR